MVVIPIELAERLAAEAERRRVSVSDLLIEYADEGKRSDRLRARVLDTVTPCIDSDSRGARWVARGVSRELVSTQARKSLAL